ncbi:MAG: UPF0280 family protein [Peptococcia bacterium]
MVYEPRSYRKLYGSKDLSHFQVRLVETDLAISVDKGLSIQELAVITLECVDRYRRLLEKYIGDYPEFLTTLEPFEPLGQVNSAILAMCEAARLAGVGPMAAVAGLISEKCGSLLARYSDNVIVENGGDIWLKTKTVRQIAVFAGNSPFTYRIALEIGPEQTPLGICTSSGTVGHSLSIGKADAAVILAPSAVLADAVATATCNMVQKEDDLQKAAEFALSVPGVTGALVILGDKMAVLGQVKLVPLS